MENLKIVDGPILGMLLAKRAQIKGTTLLSRSEEYKSRLCSDFWNTHRENFHTSKLSPVIDSVFSIHEGWISE